MIKLFSILNVAKLQQYFENNQKYMFIGEYCPKKNIINFD